MVKGQEDQNLIKTEKTLMVFWHLTFFLTIQINGHICHYWKTGYGFSFFFHETKEILCINEFIDKYALLKVYKVRDLR